jgi:purine-binding chemotaxis protein CheW
MGEGWERVSSGMVETEEGALLLIDVAAWSPARAAAAAA